LDYEGTGLSSDASGKFYSLTVQVNDGTTSTQQLAKIYLTDVSNTSTNGSVNYVDGGNNGDTFNLGNGNDVAFGDGGSDNLSGAGDNDWVFGGQSGDTLTGNNGIDILYGGGGSDSMAGGNQSDTFVFADGWTTGVDTITDFSGSGGDGDKLLLANDYAGLFTTLSSSGGHLDATQFASGAGLATASSTSIHVIYDTTTGNLYYDADGAGGTSAVQFATLQGHPALTANDILVGPPPGP